MILIFLIMIQISYISSGQTDETPPLSPGFTLVSINQVTGNTEMSWTVSTSPDVAGYIIYLYEDNAGFAIDTIFNPLQTGYSVYRPFSPVRTESFVIAAIDDSANVSPLSNVLKTIFCNAEIDSCNKRINLRWDKYPSFPSDVVGYDILRSVNGGSYNIAGQVSDNDTVYVSDDFVNRTVYCYAIRARLANGLFSYSNKSCVTVRTQQVPAWINADYATVTAFDDISLAFTIDPSSESDLFRLERKTDPAGNYEPIASIRSSIKTITYIDNEGDPNRNNFYRLSAINSCNLPERTSNVASNIVLKAEQGTDGNIMLKWNSYYKWNGEISYYRVYIDTGNGFTQQAVLSPSDTTHSISVSEIMFGTTGGKVCFYVMAAEASNPYGINGESRSNTACYNVEEIITVPNIFTPNGDSKNDLFAPVLTFTPSEYTLIISNRHGRVVFETNDYMESWDGKDKSNPAQEGVYIWIIRARNATGKKISKTGTVTIYKNKQ
ncbi:MAG: gliding motility-associated C-terminal domain-containing protein [Bacteroidales bacterium]|nr:gliding motility-associated C-terminal domain-containing protein [Bacteroidales bacterium]